VAAITAIIMAMARVQNIGTTAAGIADGGMAIATGSWLSRGIATEADTCN
jgi:hypothetical protein